MFQEWSQTERIHQQARMQLRKGLGYIESVSPEKQTLKYKNLLIPQEEPHTGEEGSQPYVGNISNECKDLYLEKS